MSYNHIYFDESIHYKATHVTGPMILMLLIFISADKLMKFIWKTSYEIDLGLQKSLAGLDQTIPSYIFTPIL